MSAGRKEITRKQCPSIVINLTPLQKITQTYFTILYLLISIIFLLIGATNSLTTRFRNDFEQGKTEMQLKSYPKKRDLTGIPGISKDRIEIKNFLQTKAIRHSNSGDNTPAKPLTVKQAQTRKHHGQCSNYSYLNTRLNNGSSRETVCKSMFYLLSSSPPATQSMQRNRNLSQSHRK